MANSGKVGVGGGGGEHCSSSTKLLTNWRLSSPVSPSSNTLVSSSTSANSTTTNLTMVQQQQQQQQQPSTVTLPTTTTSNDLVNILRHQKRIIWGEEVPSPMTSMSMSEMANQDNYVMTMGVSPLITIGPLSRNNGSNNSGNVAVGGGGGGGGGSTISNVNNNSTNVIPKDEIVTITSSTVTNSVVQQHLSRVLELDQLRNYFQLIEPSDSGSVESKFGNGSQYFLSLLDQSMPRLTNCGHYYRMRYAVYALPRSVTRSMNTSNWRNRGQQSSAPSVSDSDSNSIGRKRTLLLHIGEMHLYTIFPKDGVKPEPESYSRDLLPKWCRASSIPTTVSTSGKGSNYIHYENISFFLNQTPLTDDEWSTLKVSENEVNQMSMNFRRFLKQLNSIVVNVCSGDQQSTNGGAYNSTCLLEQLKYPKTGDFFLNPDRISEQFLRNQAEMFARYQAYHSGVAKYSDDPIQNLNSECSTDGKWSGKVLPLPAIGASTSSSSNSSTIIKDLGMLLNETLFVETLHRLKNQAELKSCGQP
ncbi:hypothetical protein RDWZM_003720 [Blomia tropicalis]|uniref:Uncharacterized protein n=1 Tax=Blomia tropicalis TaxID=40697 RepID=A0A9Q0RSZ1_BLOTA|nr:hypothetical protein RDWZM_003720 [Blomia tropicalis]